MKIIYLLIILILILYLINFYIGKKIERFENNKTPTFHILITSIGRPQLVRQINSLIPQLNENDHITIVFDGVDIMKLDTKKAKCKIHLYKENKKLGFWGHAIRNKYAKLIEKTDFVLHADDDDYYLDNVFNRLRKKCKDKNT